MSIEIELPASIHGMYKRNDQKREEAAKKKEEKEAKSAKSKRKRKKKRDYSTGFDIKESDLIVTMSCSSSETTDEGKLYPSHKKNEKDSLEIKFNNMKDLDNWDYENNIQLK
ncbi:hypothetical protein FUT12_20480 [Bacillus mycoides]|uniref:hypothetical protein n=1 Tax=Bacillus mycoides TaxID=1405 RepID=UPI00187A624F|nr:hypothetical protein [Bacillus mycoides]MBE7149898.1 hypothetical protein [Bacillus mycoides]